MRNIIFKGTQVVVAMQVLVKINFLHILLYLQNNANFLICVEL